MTVVAAADPFAMRRAGVLLHPTALPGDSGVLGQSARTFIDFMAASGLSVWQTLPLGPTHQDRSPYQSLSARAGNPDLVDLAELVSLELLTGEELVPAQPGTRKELLTLAAQRFFTTCNSERSGPELTGFREFRHTNEQWLEDFCLFSAIRETLDTPGWLYWPPKLRDRNPVALHEFRASNLDRINRILFEQYLFHHQWQALRHYALQNNILLFGDIPIFVAHDSADVWANRSLFKLDTEGNPTVVAGVPPDYFSDTGQHWGNPLYDWQAMARDGYQWWLERLESQQQLFDLIRIDHFRGLRAYWEIPAHAPDPRNGQWAAGPGEHFLEACFRRFPKLPMVAENLGIIGQDVEELRNRFCLPGMTVIQFGFDGSPDNPHLPENHHGRDLVYTGTHDNDTTLGWYQSLDASTRARVDQHLGSRGEDMPWPAIDAAFRSVCWLAMVPMQDYLGLGTEARFNTPGTTVNNWAWTLAWQLCPDGLSDRIRRSVAEHGRLPG